MAIASGRKGEITIKTPAAAGDSLATVYATTAANLYAIRSWTIDSTSDTLDTTSMTDASTLYRSFVPAFKSWTASVDILYDITQTDPGNDPTKFLRAGEYAVINIFPEGNVGSTDARFGGNCLVTGFSRKATYDGLVEMTVSFQGIGSLSQDKSS
jgi:predicted secreted protein